MESSLHSGERQGGGLVDTNYARRTQQLIKLMTELRSIGAHADLDLPRIAVIGNQSAGKSSLVEAISGITVPRASGTCTRCPMECRLQNTPGPWKCQVLLRFEKDGMGNHVTDVKEIKFGPPVREKSELEGVIRRAQLAILNQGVPYQNFVDCDLDEPEIWNQKPLKFSSNVVALDVSGPDVADLSFIDLPGIISNVADGEDRNNITFVQDIVKEHIRGNALILLTLTMRDDLENQSAAFLAKEADPEGLRTVGVLTKADTILQGEESGWLDVLEGRRHVLKKGYYVTKQPGPEELSRKPSSEENRLQERTFFETREPWRSTSNLVKSRIGIPNLTAELSKLLSHLIMQTLPTLRESARAALDHNSKAQATLPPPPPDNPLVELLRLLSVFSATTRQHIDGTEKHEQLVRVYRKASADFKLKISRTIPNFRPFKDEDEEENLGKNFDDSVEDAGTEPAVRDCDRRPPIFLPYIRKYIENSLGRELPFNIPFSAKRGLIEMSFAIWPKHASSLFETVFEAVRRQLNDVIEEQFGRFIMSSLKDSIKNAVDKQLDRLREETTSHIRLFLEMEHPPFTQNLHYFSLLRDKHLSKYKAARSSSPAFSKYTAAKALAELTSLGFEGLVVGDLYKLTKTDSYEQELTVMAEVSAYCCIACKRVIDDVPRILDHDFLQALGKSIQNALMEDFAIGSEGAIEQARTYLAEDPNDVARRDDLRTTERRLIEVLRKLLHFAF